MNYAPGTELVRPGKPDEVFTVDKSGRFARRAYGPAKLNHADGNWYMSSEFVDTSKGTLVAREKDAGA